MKNDETTPGVNGQVLKKPRKSRAKKAEKPCEGYVKIIEARAVPENERGRLASELRARGVDWLLKPWIPRGMLTLLAGLPGVGKSTFLAWLVAHAGCACILPGYEEDVEVTTLPRLTANGANLNLVRFLDDRDYRLPRDKSRIAKILKAWEAEVLVIDPIESYMEEELNENVGQDVRLMLESASWIAKETGAAVVGVRHPGKERTNVMAGSRQWRAVPREIIELFNDGNIPPRFLIRHFKDSLGQDARPRQYRLEGERGKPRRFVLAEEVDASMSGLADVTEDVTEGDDIAAAGRLIREVLTASSEMSVEDFRKRCEKEGVSERSRRKAFRLLGIRPKSREGGGKWYMFRKETDWPSWTDEL